MLKRILKRPACLGLLLLLGILAWHFRPISRDVLIPVTFSNGQEGYINGEGRVAFFDTWHITVDFDSANMAAVQKEGKWGYRKWGYIDRSGKIVVPLDWDYASDFDSAGMAHVSKNQKSGCIDRSGKIGVPLEWSYIDTYASYGLTRELADLIRVWVFREEKIGGEKINFGCIHRSGKIVIEPRWNRLELSTDHDSKKHHLVATKQEPLTRVRAVIDKGLEWLTGRPASTQRTICHVYETNGQLIWQSDAIPYHLIFAGIGMLLIGLDVLMWIARRRRES